MRTTLGESPPYGGSRRYLVSRSREVIDLLASWGALTLAFAAGEVLQGNYDWLIVSAVAVATAFVFHEIAHRQVARRYNLFARYKAWYKGLVLAIAVAFISAKLFGTPFIIAAPGAVYVMAYYGIPPPDIEFRVSIAGPAANMLVAIALFIASVIVPYPLSIYLRFISNVNAWIAFFNLLPIPPLDGFKVIRYSLTTWLVVIAAAFAIFLIT